MFELSLFGYAAAVLMGIVLGLIGGGGSILTVPILVYFMAVPPVIATAYSLLIVGTTAAFGVIRFFRQGLIEIKTILLFAVPSVIAVYLSRAFLLPRIPDPIMTQPWLVTKDTLLMTVFAVLMIVSAIAMLRSTPKSTIESGGTAAIPPEKQGQKVALIMLEGGVVGVVTGMLGAGGGFLIIPALVLLLNMPMQKAVGASLLIIAVKSLIGFIGDLQHGLQLQLPLVALMLVATFGGMMMSGRLAGYLNDAVLKKAFAFFVLTTGTLILIKELL